MDAIPYSIALQSMRCPSTFTNCLRDEVEADFFCEDDWPRSVLFDCLRAFFGLSWNWFWFAVAYCWFIEYVSVWN